MILVGLSPQFPSVYVKKVLEEKLEEDLKKINLIQPAIDVGEKILDSQLEKDKGVNVDLNI